MRTQLERDNPGDDYLKSTCDHILQVSSSTNIDSDSDHDPNDSESLLGHVNDRDSNPDRITLSSTSRDLQSRAFFIRTLALLCACSLSVGSHYGTNILGPLKSRIQREIGASHTEYGLLFAAFSLNSTWTPLLGGVLASRLGTTFTSILATGIILLGQLFLLCGDIWGDIRLMTLGLFIFGLGVSPLAVVQETIIVRFFKSHGLGVSMAFGLVAGKGASFISARTSYPITERFGTHAPFYIATFLALLSVIVNLMYISLSKWMIDGAGAELEAPDISDEARRRLTINMTEAQALEKVAERRKVHLRQLTKLGDLFWVYMALNLFCGMIWSPFTHLAANIIQNRYHMSEEDAANSASYLLAGSLVLYPLCGYLVDRRRQHPIVIQLLLLSSLLTILSYIWFDLLPSWTKTPVPGIIAFAFGHGFSPLLLVVLVPKIVPSKYISTALGAHKCMEQTGSTLFQTLAGLLLDSTTPSKDTSTTSFQYLLNIFVVLNFMECGAILALAYLQSRKDMDGKETMNNRDSPILHQESPLLHAEDNPRYIDSNISRRRTNIQIELRGRFMALCCAALVIFAWALFLSTAWRKLGKKHF